MITFAGTLPRLDNIILDNNFLKEEVQDFLWKLKASNPNLVFVFSDFFKSSEDSKDSFKFFVGKDNRYLKDLDIFVDFVKTIENEYQVDKIVCELVDEDIEIDSCDIFLKDLLSFFSDKNVIFIEYPKANQSDYAILGQLLGELAKSDKFNIALVASGHLSRSGDQSKPYFDRRAKEIDDTFVEQLKVDLFSIFNMNFYTSRVEALGGGQALQAVSGAKQSLYEGTLIIVAALSSLIANKPHRVTEGFEIISAGIVAGTYQLLSVFYRSTNIDIDYSQDYSIEEFLNLLIRSKVIGFQIDYDLIKLDLPKDFQKIGFFLELAIGNQYRECFGDPELEINETNIKQVFDIFVTNLLTKRVKLKDLDSIKTVAVFSQKGFGIFKISTIKDLLNYNIIAFRTNKTEKYFILKDKSIDAFIDIFSSIQKDSKEIQVFGLK